MSYKNISIKIVSDKSKEVIAAMKKQLQNGFMACGTIAEGYAKDECPVDTGRLRNSITWAVRGNSGKGDGRDTPNAEPEEATVYIGTNVEYAPHVEFKDMSHKTGNAHFLKNSVANHIDEYEKTIEAALKS